MDIDETRENYYNNVVFLQEEIRKISVDFKPAKVQNKMVLLNENYFSMEEKEKIVSFVNDLYKKSQTNKLLDLKSEREKIEKEYYESTRA